MTYRMPQADLQEMIRGMTLALSRDKYVEALSVSDNVLSLLGPLNEHETRRENLASIVHTKRGRAYEGLWLSSQKNFHYLSNAKESYLTALRINAENEEARTSLTRMLLHVFPEQPYSEEEGTDFLLQGMHYDPLKLKTIVEDNKN